MRSRLRLLLRRARPLLTAGAAVLAALLLFVAMAAFERGELEAPEPTLLLTDRDGRFLGEVCAGQSGYGYWPLDELPQRVVEATLAAEDRRFWSHPGVDAWAVGRAAWQNVRYRRRISGASTVAMQVARMQRPGRRAYGRKAVEATTALVLTARYGREQVLLHYLRLVPYGNRVHGIAYAARRYLDKPVEDLSWAEAAFLAALPQAPGRMNPFDPKGRRRAMARGRRILDALAEAGALSQAEYELACEQIQKITVPRRGRRQASMLHSVVRLEQMLCAADRRRSLDSPYVQTTLDLGLSKQVAGEALRSLNGWRERGAGNTAVMVLDRQSSEVRVALGSADYFDAAGAGAIDFTRVKRAAGSTLKPFLYALALERGDITPATILDDIRRGAGGIQNADDGYLGPLLPRVALANSRNVPAADLLARVGLGEGYAFLGELDLHDSTIPSRHFGLGLALGGLAVTLEDLTRAYGVLADGGRLHDLVWYRGQPVSPSRRLLSEDTARLLSLFLSDPMARLPSFPRMGSTEYAFPVAAKTGTSCRYRDAWTLAYSTRHIVGVWVGHPDARPMNHLSGSRSAARLAQRVMNLLEADHADGLSDLAFPPPRGYRPLRLCALSGKRASEACDRVAEEWFAPGTEPVASCPVHLRLAVDVRTGLLATPHTPARHARARTFLSLPPRYAAWAARSAFTGQERAPRALGRPGTGVPGLVRITTPEPGLTLLRDPEVPAALATLALEAEVETPTPQLVWYVDGRPWKTVDHPYTARWPLSRGEHTFQAHHPVTGAVSPPVRVVVQ